MDSKDRRGNHTRYHAEKIGYAPQHNTIGNILSWFYPLSTKVFRAIPEQQWTKKIGEVPHTRYYIYLCGENRLCSIA